MTVALRTRREKAPALRRGLCFARALAYISCAALLFSCASAPAPLERADYIPAAFEWQPATAYADYAVFDDGTIPLRYHCIRIDLTAPGLRVVSYPHTAGAFAGKSTRAFARETGAQIAVNATPFKGRFLLKHTVGVHGADGATLSAPVQKYDALVFEQMTDGLRARIVVGQDETQCAGAAYAFGGFWAVVRDGAKQAFAHTSYNARTAAGISADGRTLFLLVVERNAGLSYQQCADIFLALGAEHAIQLDGGHSSDLVLNGQSVLVRGGGRTVGVSFGFVQDERRLSQ